MNMIDTARPEVLAEVSAERITELDVRPVLRSGGEPFSQIMDAAAGVPPGGVLRLRATFKPVPLFGVMSLKGWDHWIESGAGDDWCVWFYRRKEFA